MSDNTTPGSWITPDLARTPALAYDASKSQNPAIVAPLLSYANKGVAVQNAITDHAESYGTKSFWAKVASPAITGLEWLGKGIKEIQRDYKFTHAVYTDHGFMQGFAVTLGIIGGGIGGGLLAGPAGAIVGADLAATGLRKLSTVPLWKDTYSDSYAKSEDENYKVSPGRDFSNAASKAFEAIGSKGLAKDFKDTNKGIGKLTSGIGDLTFDIVADPVMVLGRFNQLMKAGKLLKEGTLEMKYPIMDTVPGVKNFIISHTKSMINSEQIDAVRAGGVFNSVSRTYNRALSDIANTIKNAVPDAAKKASASAVAAGELASKYPTLGVKTVGRMALEKLDTPDKVHEFLKTSLYFGEIDRNIAGQAILPSRTLLRATLGGKTVAETAQKAFLSGLSKIPGVTSEMVSAIANGAETVVGLPSDAIDYLRNSPKFPGKIYKTFSGYMPYSVDPRTGELSLTRFRWDAPDAATFIYRIGRFGMGDRAAKIMAGKYSEAVAIGSVGLARAIKNQTLLETFKALGLPDDAPLVKLIQDEINKIDIPITSTQVYGVRPDGSIISSYMTNEGPKVGGIVSGQAQDMFTIPDFFEVKKAMVDAGLHNKYLGGLNEWTAKLYTNKIFKPLALATAGFGLRIAASELIPTFARYGVINTFKARLASSVAKERASVIPDEVNNIFAATMTALGLHLGIAPDVMKAGFPAFKEAKRRGLEFAAKMLPAEQIDLATRLVIANQSHLMSEAVTTGHGYDADVRYQMSQASHYYIQMQKDSPAWREKQEWTTYNPSDIHYVPRYATNLNKAGKEIAYRNISKDLLDQVALNEKAIVKIGQVAKVNPNVVTPEFYNTDEFQNLREVLVNKEYSRMLDAVNGKYKGYDKEMKVIDRWIHSVSSGTLRDFATDRVDSTLGMLFGRNGTFHKDFAEAIANEQKVDFDRIIELYNSDRNSLPASVAGPSLVPYTPPKSSLVSTITNLGFKKVIDPIVNWLAREPLYVMHVADAYGRMLPQIKNGILTEDQALRLAQTQGSLSMLPQIHNTALRNQFAQMARNILPFYFAQEQALRRAFATLKDTSIASPAFSRGLQFYQLVEHALSDPTFVQEDENGNKYISFWGTGAFGELASGTLKLFNMEVISGLPISAKGSLVSLKSVLPELQMPGVSPLFSVFANIIGDLFPETKGVVKTVVGNLSYQKGVLDSLIPATWAKTLLAAGTDIKEGISFDITGQYGNALFTALATAYYYNQVPDEAAPAAEKQAFIDRIKNNARSALLVKTFLNLVSPLAPKVEISDPGIREEFWKLVKQKGDIGSALIEYMGNHGTRAVSYTIAKTVSNAAGAKYPYIQQTIDFINEHHDKFFTPQGQPSVSAGWFFLIPQDNPKNESDRAVYNELFNMHLRSRKTPEQLLNSFYIAQGDAIMDPLITQHIANMKKYEFDPYMKKLEQDSWSAQMKKMQTFHPVWYDSYTSGDARRQAQTTYNQLVSIFSSPNPPQHEQAKLVYGLMQKYQSYQAVMNQYDMLNLQGVASTAEKQSWQDYLYTLREKEPRLKPVIDSVFRKLG